MEEAVTDPLDISKDPELIKDAQKDLSKTDVLVCGGCHEVFYFLEEFQAHKEAKTCTEISALKCEHEEKSQIWGFSLWKVKQTQIHQTKGEEVPTSWEIYQKWTKLLQADKDIWIKAGQTLMICSKIANTKLKEINLKERDPLAIESENGIGLKKALRSNNESEKEEYNVEKIVAKRFNPKKRIWEYKVKWEHYAEGSSSETWEPAAHLENCKVLVQEYEERLKLVKERDKQLGAATPRGRGRPRGSMNPAMKLLKKAAPVLTPPIESSPEGGRAPRASKQKALNQVKAWCGSISDEEGGVKRSYDDDDDSDDSYEKRIKLEGESEDTEEEEPKTPMRKLTKAIQSYNNNGTGRKLPDNVLIPDAKGVVRISQKQLPSFSSGVYIMSKSSGLIKLDATASKIATSGGQAIVKVSPKVGQTHIKIIKKDDGNKRVIGSKSDGTGLKQTPKIVHHVISKSSPIISGGKTPTIVRKDLLDKALHKPVEGTSRLTPKPTPEPKKEAPKAPIFDDESDDGIEELEFPTDLPLPGPDSPPGDFILDPITGKVVGQDYPEPEPLLDEKKELGTETIDNIVKLAAADITEEDLKTDDVPTTEPLTIKTEIIATSPSAVGGETTVTTTNAIPPSVYTVVKSSPSILNSAMTNSNILQKTLQTPKPKTQPRIINQSVAKPRTSISPIIRSSATTPRPVIRSKQQSTLPKPKFNINQPPNVASPVRNVYTKHGPSLVKKVIAPSPKPKVAPPIATIVRKTMAPKMPATPKPVISMPSLDDEPVVAAAPKVTAAPTVAVAEESTAVETDLSTFALQQDGRPMFITGDDGTVYQVAGQNEEGQTILVTQDSDGQQQCLIVAGDGLQDQVEQVEPASEIMMEVQEPVEVSEEQPLVAQLIRAEPPSPGGTHKVVVMLPDGDIMMTEVTPEEFASLELDK